MTTAHAPRPTRGETGVAEVYRLRGVSDLNATLHNKKVKKINLFALKILLQHGDKVAGEVTNETPAFPPAIVTSNGNNPFYPVGARVPPAIPFIGS